MARRRTQRSDENGWGGLTFPNTTTVPAISPGSTFFFSAWMDAGAPKTATQAARPSGAEVRENQMWFQSTLWKNTHVWWEKEYGLIWNIATILIYRTNMYWLEKLFILCQITTMLDGKWLLIDGK
jgi:hypothetical protein